MPAKSVTPPSRYVPMVQQPFCCVPASILTAMARHRLPLVPQELLGYHLGLTVPPEEGGSFYHVRTAKKPPFKSGFGTQIQNPRYHPNKAFRKLGIPLAFTYQPTETFPTVLKFRKRLEELMAQDADVAICLHWGALVKDKKKDFGHVMLVDRVNGDEVQLVDTSRGVCKWCTFKVADLYRAAKRHTEESMGGLWIFEITRSTRKPHPPKTSNE